MLYKYLFSILCGHLNLNKKIKFDQLPVKPAGIPVRTGWTAPFEFKFDFDRYRPVSGQTGPVYRYRTRPVWPDRSVRETLAPRRATPPPPSSPGRPDASEERGDAIFLHLSPRRQIAFRVCVVCFEPLPHVHSGIWWGKNTYASSVEVSLRTTLVRELGAAVILAVQRVSTNGVHSLTVDI